MPRTESATPAAAPMPASAQSNPSGSRTRTIVVPALAESCSPAPACRTAREGPPPKATGALIAFSASAIATAVVKDGRVLISAANRAP